MRGLCARWVSLVSGGDNGLVAHNRRYHRMTRLSKALIVSLAVVFIALGVAACGSDDDDSGGGGKTGGSIKIGSVATGQVRPHAEPDDPGLPGPAARLRAAEHLQARPRQRGRRRSFPGSPRACPRSRTAARPTSSSFARDSSTATAARSRPATSRTPSSAWSSPAARSPRSLRRNRGHRQAEELRRRPERHRHRRQDR